MSEQIYPVWTYAYLGLLVFVFLLTDMVRYKPMIIFEALGYIATWTLLIWGRGVVQMQVSPIPTLMPPPFELPRNLGCVKYPMIQSCDASPIYFLVSQ